MLNEVAQVLIIWWLVESANKEYLYDYFNNENSKYAIELYESVHGIMNGFKEDMEGLADIWDVLTFDERTSGLHTIMIKYQNKRANGKGEILSTAPAS